MEASLTIILNRILTAAAKRRALNVHLAVGSYPVFRIDDDLVELTDEAVVTSDFIKKIADDWLDSEQQKKLKEEKEIIFVKEISKNFRVKVNFFFQKNLLSISLRLIPARIPPLVSLGLPKAIYSLTDKKSGLIIVTGPYGSGRTTTVASMVEEINNSRKENIITIEKPIEYIFVNNKSLIEQREVGTDVNSFSNALEYAQQADVDLIVVGATPDPGIIPLVLEFANSGRLAFLVMDTTSVVQTVEEIFASFSGDEKSRGQLLLSGSLLAIIAQRLVPKAGGGLVLAAEVLMATESVRSLIAENRIKQLTTVLQTSRAEGMLSLDQSLAELVKSGEVLIDKAIEYAADPENFRSRSKS
ncbi:MAG: ATPase, T2SS/T4P/T4SS family [Patescibacteria group bacterium]|jgi:twitching motility protein PilT